MNKHQLLLGCVAAFAASVASAAPWPGFTRGMGIGGWLTNYKRFNVLPMEKRLLLTEGDFEHFDTYITEKDVANIKSMGFDHIRLGFDQIVLEETPGKFRERTFRKVDDFVGWCAQHDLGLVLNLHKAVGNYCDIPEKVSLMDDPQLQERFIALWLEFERRYHDRPKLVFELLNEVRDVAPEKWNDLADRAIRAIRAQNPERWIVVGPTCWNNPPKLPQLKVWDDPRIVYTFHMYWPHEFTHQRGVLQAGPLAYNRVLEYPSTDVARYAGYYRFHGRGDGPFGDGRPMDRSRLAEAMRPAFDFVKAHPDKILWNGEFGTIRHAPKASRVAYMRDVVSLCKEHGIPWCVWNYLSTPNDGNRFSLVDDDTREILSRELLNACLGRAEADYTALKSCVDTRDTRAIQQEIDRAWKAGGGRVVVPSGVHHVGGLRLRSNVELHLASNAVLSASRNCDDFEILADDTLESVNPKYVKEARGWSMNAPRDRSKPWIASTNYVVRWNNGVIRILNATNVVISGEAGSVIDGNNSYDPDGEERYRGVHGISCFYSSNVVVRGIELRNTGNWATRFAYSDDLRFENLTIRGGHDGVHVRGCDRVRVKDCDIRCGDDCIAGFDNSDVTVEDCRLNTACSAFRFGGTHLRVKRCCAWGPAEWPFRGSLTPEEKRQGVSSQGRGRGNLLSFWTYFADFTQPVRRPQGDIVIEDCTVENADRFLHYNFSGNETWQKGTPLGDIRFERVKATGIGASLCAYASPMRPLTLTLNDCDIAFRKPQPEFIRGAHIGSVLLENLRVTTVEGPCVRSWSGTPEIMSSGCKGLNAETQPATTKFSTRSI